MKLSSPLCFTLCLLSSSALANTPGHGPRAPGDAFAHRFQWRAHQPERPQLAFHFGLLQPLLLRGFNAAVDLRWGRFIATYSHGQGLNVDLAPGVLTQSEERAGLEIFVPYSTGFGLGAVLFDEFYALIDFKLHSYSLRLNDSQRRYKTITVGAELGYRLFLWKGLHIAPVLRFWPNVWSSLDGGSVSLGPELEHKALKQGLDGFFINVLIGWAFEV